MQYTPPFVPPRGEVNAIDAIHIGVFETDEVKGVKVSRASLVFLIGSHG